jgi:hypothetical protein
MIRPSIMKISLFYALIAFGSVWPGPSMNVHAAPCPPTAVITGEEALVHSLFATDALSDVSAEALPGCPAIWVTVTQQPAGLVVQIGDHLGRRYERTVGDVQTAAALVESWARGDTLMSALPALDISGDPAPSQTETPEPLRSPPAPAGPESGSPAPKPAAGITVEIGFEYTMGADGSSWFGGQGYFCSTLGIACIGALIRGAADPTVTGRYRELTDIRASMDVLIIATLPIEVRRIRVSPLVGLGAGWVQTSREMPGEREMPDDEVDVKEASYGGVRLALSAMISINLVQGLFLDMAAGLTTSFIAEEPKVIIEGETVAGEPRHYLHLVTGLSYRWS